MLLLSRLGYELDLQKYFSEPSQIDILRSAMNLGLSC